MHQQVRRMSNYSDPQGDFDRDESRPYRRRFYTLLFVVIAMIAAHLSQDGNEFTERSFSNKPVVVVTGSTSGIGFEMAKRLVISGVDVFGTYRNDKDRSNLEQYRIKPLKMEMTNASSIIAAEVQIRSYVQRERREFLGIISNAGVLNAGPLEKVSFAFLDETIDVHLKGTITLVKTFLDLVMSSKGGRILIVGSLAAVWLPPANAACTFFPSVQRAKITN
jgi:NADP-dependent 3-hydroxy acid dehydrogenase YdfG